MQVTVNARGKEADDGAGRGWSRGQTRGSGSIVCGRPERARLSVVEAEWMEED